MGEGASRSHPGTAAVLSFVCNGLGQLYNGHIAKGLVLIFFSGVSLLIFIMGSVLIGAWLLEKEFFQGGARWGCVLFISGFVSMCGIGIYSIVDAFKTAKGL